VENILNHYHYHNLKDTLSLVGRVVISSRKDSKLLQEDLWLVAKGNKTQSVLQGGPKDKVSLLKRGMSGEYTKKRV